MRLFAFLLAFLPLVAFGQTTPTFQVKTVANLTAQPIPIINNRLTALVVGGLTTNDGRGGLYFYDANSALAADADWDVVASTGAGKWIRQNWELRGRMNSSNNVALRWKNIAGTYVDILSLDASDNVRIFTPAGKQTQVDVELVSPTIDATLGFQINNLAPVGEYPRGNGTRFVSSTIQAGDLPAALFANPSTQIGLTAVNGVATTALRSDGAPSLSQSIAPFWTADHIFGALTTITNVIDPKLTFVTAGTNLSIGIDTSANSDFVVSQSGTLGTSDIIRMQRDGDKIAIGLGAVAGAASTIAIGDGAVSTGFGSVTIGTGTTTSADNTVAIGYGVQGGANINVAIGSGARAGATGVANTVVGDDAWVLSDTVINAVAIGRVAKATNNSVAVGMFAEASATGTIGVGRLANASHQSSIVLGDSALSTLTSQLVIGSPGTPIRRVSIGSGADSASMLDLDFNFTQGVGTDISAEDVTFNAMRPTGNGDGGRFHFFTPTESTVSSSTLAVMAERFTIESTNNLGAKIMLPFDYTGSGLARGLLIQAGSISTGIRLLQGAENAAGNVGGWAETTASGEGAAAGFFGRGFGGTNSYGLVGDATTGQRVEVDGVSVGVVGVASNALGSVIGVLGKLGTNAPAFASGAVVADNGPSLKSIFLGMSNGITKFAVNSTGSITNAGGLAVGGFADPGVGNATIPGVGTIGTVTSALINAPATMVIDPVNDLHILTRYMGIRTVSPDAVLDVWDAGTDRPSALNVQIDDVNVFPLTFYNSSLPAAHGGSPSTGVRFRLSNSGEFKISNAKTNGSLIFNTFDTNRWSVDGTGQFLPQVDNFYDIGRNDLRVKTNWNVTVDTTNLLVRSLTATRVPFAAANGEVDDDADFTFGGSTNLLTAGKLALTDTTDSGQDQLKLFALGNPTAADTEYLTVFNTTSLVRINSGRSGTGTANPIRIEVDGVPNIRFEANALTGVNRTPTESPLEVGLSGDQQIPMFKLQSGTSGETVDDKIMGWFQGSLATTDATTADVQIIPITASRTYLINARVVARRTGGAAGTADDGAVYIRRAMVTTKAGTVTINAVQDDLTQEDQAAWDCTFDVNLASVRIRFTGAVNNNVSIHSTTEVSFVGQ